MKIVLLNAVFGSGSTGVIVKDLYDIIEYSGNQAYAAYSTTTENVKQGYSIGNKFDRFFHAIYTRIFGLQGYASKKSTKKFIKYLDEISPDVLHMHNLHSNYINLPILLKYCAEKSIKVVITLHDCWFFTGKCFHFSESQCEKWITECKKCPRNKLDIKSWFFDRSNKAFKDKKRLFSSISNLIVVGCSEWISSLARESNVFKDNYITTVRNGVDLEIFKPSNQSYRKENGLENKFVILGMANKWLNSSNKDTVNRFLSDLSNDCIVVLVGVTTCEVDIVSDKIIQLGFISDKHELAKLYSSADVFVNLTLADTLPTVNMESIACGTPVVTYNVGGSPELVSNGETGYIIEKFDVDGLKEAIKNIKNGQILKSTCREYALHHFDKNKNYYQYLDLYNRSI